MITDRNTLFYRYWNALNECDDGDARIHTGAVRLALRLAIDEAIALSAPAQTLDQRVNEHLGSQISRLNDWLQVHEPGLYISPGDTADAVLAALGNRDQRIAELSADLDKLQTYVDAECADLQEELTSARNELALLIANRDALANELLDVRGRLSMPALVTVLQTDYSQADHANGAAPNPTTTPEWNRNHPAWDGLSDEQRVTVYQLASGDLRFRNISKEDRLDLVGRVLRHLTAAGETVTGPQFDRLKPHWMPTAGAVVLLAESRKWQDLLALTMEPAPA